MNLTRVGVGFASILMLGLAACHSKNPDDTTTPTPAPVAAKTGAFQISQSSAGGVCGKCSPVANVAYTTIPGGGGAKAARSGVTNALGQFQYDEGDGVNFTLGGIDLGSAQAGAEVTVADIAQAELAAGTPPANTDEGDYATNLTQFLLTYDQDGNPDNGITITAQTVAASASVTILFEQPLETFDDEGGDFDDLNDQTTTEPVSQDAARETLGTGAAAGLAGTWVVVDAQGAYKTDATVTFFDNGYYLYGATNASPEAGCETTTVEFGRFIYDGASSKFRTSTPSLYTNTIGSGDDYYCDSVHVSAQEQEESAQRLELGSDTLTFSFDAQGQACEQDETTLPGGRCGNVLKRAPSGTGVAGAWLGTPIAESNSAPGVFVFFGNTSGRYIFVDSRGEMPGVESGSFTIGANNVLSAVHSGPGNFDSNGDNGINETEHPRVYVSATDSRRLNFVDEQSSDECKTEGQCYLTRLPQAAGETRPQPLADQLLGSWTQLNAQGLPKNNNTLSFFKNGKYLFGTHENAPGCNVGGDTGPNGSSNGNGLEYGGYSWNPSTGAFSVSHGSMTAESNGFCGLNESPQASTNNLVKLSIVNGTLVFYDNDAGDCGGDAFTTTEPGFACEYRFARIGSQPGTLAGSFLARGSLVGGAPAVISLFPTSASNDKLGRYLLATTNTDVAHDVDPGIEEGCYSVDATNVITVDLNPSTCPNAIDTNATGGISHPIGDSYTLRVTSNNTLTINDDQDSTVLVRLPLLEDDALESEPATSADFVDTFKVVEPVDPARPNKEIYLTFLADGRYIKGGREDDPNCQPGGNHSSNVNPESGGNGYEIGTWSFAAASATLSSAVTDDTDGDCGLGGEAIAGWVKFSDDSLGLGDGSELRLVPVRSTTSSLTGAWHFAGTQGQAGTPQTIAAQARPFIAIFKPDNSYAVINLVNVGNASCDGIGNGGIEIGTYSLSGGIFSATSASLNTDGECGFFHQGNPQMDTLTFNSPTQFSLAAPDGTSVFTKLTSP